MGNTKNLELTYKEASSLYDALVTAKYNTCEVDEGDEWEPFLVTCEHIDDCQNRECEFYEKLAAIKHLMEKLERL